MSAVRPSLGFGRLCVLSLLAILAWAALGRVDRTSAALGEVVPSGRVRRVEHLEGGIVREILAREGDVVEAGQPLVVLEQDVSASDLAGLELRLEYLALNEARLSAEASGLTPEFPAAGDLARPGLLQEIAALHQARMERYEREQAALAAAVAEAEQDGLRVAARRESLEAVLGLLNQEVALSAGLLADDLTTEQNHLQLLREQSEAAGRLDEAAAAQVQAEAALAEAKERLERLSHAFREDAAQELAEVRQSLAQLREREARIADSVDRTVVRSPVAGVVQALAVISRGEVVEPGETLALVVPVGEALVVEARINVADIGYVSPGQPARIKALGQDSGTWGALDGVVASVSPDAAVGQDGSTGYQVRIATMQTAFTRGERSQELTPGMPVLVTIHTGSRSVLKSVLAPLLDAASLALRER